MTWLPCRCRKPPVIVSEENDMDLQKIANNHRAVLLLFVSPLMPTKRGSMKSVRSEICALDEYSVDNVLDQIDAKYHHSERKAYLVVSSPGGDADSSFKIAKAIRRSFDDITVFVPRNAHSGGALLALVGNRIRMGRMSSLGPLDVQIAHKGEHVSANHIISAKTNLDKHLQKNKSKETLLFDKIQMWLLDPITYERACQKQKMNIEYVNQILKMAKCTNSTAVTAEMCTGFPDHDYVIDAHKAKTIGIAVEDASVDRQTWNAMRQWFLKYDTEPNELHYVRYIIPK